MKCPKCGDFTIVDETRGERRARKCRNGHRFQTVEILATHLGYLEVQRKMALARKTLRRLGYLK